MALANPAASMRSSTMNTKQTPVQSNGAKDEKLQIMTNKPEPTVADDSSDSSSDDDFYSAAPGVDDSDDDDELGEENDADWEAREKERQRVLEAAGLIVNEDVKPPPRLERARSARPRRPPPAAPQRSSIISNSSAKDLPPVPASPGLDTSVRLDDAFDRYESFRHTHGNTNRMSIASFETAPSEVSSPTISQTPSTSRDSDTRSYSHILHFLGRRTPANDVPDKRTLTISAPILNQSESPTRENSPAFGSVRI